MITLSILPSVCGADDCASYGGLHVHWLKALAAFKDIALLGLAFLGLRVWWAQLRGTTRYQAALKVLKAIYRLEDEVVQARQTLASLGSIRYHQQAGEKGFEGAKQIDPYRAANACMKFVSRAHSELRDAQVEADIFWPKDASSKLAQIFRQVGLLQLAYSISWRKEMEPPRPSEDPTSKPHTLYATEEDDHFAAQMAASVKIAKEFFRAKVR